MADAQNMLRMLADFLEGAGYGIGSRLSDSAFEVTDPDGDVYVLNARFLRKDAPPDDEEDEENDSDEEGNEE